MPAVRRTVRPLTARALALTAALMVLATAAAGCGSSQGDKPEVKALTPEGQVRVIVESFGHATANKDYGLICDRLIARSLSDNVEELGLPCERAFRKGLGAVKGANLRLDGITVQGRTAYARVHSTAVGQAPSDDTIKLQLLKGQWRIVSLDDRAGAVAHFRFF
jgi:hypothetical protein